MQLVAFRFLLPASALAAVILAPTPISWEFLTLSAQGFFNRVTFSRVGYLTITKIIIPGQVNELNVHLHSSQTQIKEVSVTSGKSKRYRNKGNPAVSLIQQIINHKDENRMEAQITFNMTSTSG